MKWTRLMLCGLSSLTCAAALADDWPNFRGPQHDGISRETGLKVEWTTAIPLVWEREIGDAFSGVSVVGGRLYTCGEQDRRQTVLCLDASTGAVIWQTPFEDKYIEGQGGNGTRSTPTVHDGSVYVLGALGRLVCLDAESGREIWSKKFGDVPQWGYSGSVLIDGDLAIVSPGGKDGALLALNPKTGSQVWSTGEAGPGYATPYPFDFAGKRYIVGFTESNALVVDAKTGKIAWSTPWKTDWGVNAAAPIFQDGLLFLSSGYTTGSAVFRLTADGDGLRGEQVWKHKELMNKFQSSVLFEGHLYASDQNGLRCVKLDTGEVAWKERRAPGSDRTAKDSTLVIADGHIFLLGEWGDLFIAPATPSGFKPLTRAELASGLCWTVPTISNGKLYVRCQSRLACFDLRAK